MRQKARARSIILAAGPARVVSSEVPSTEAAPHCAQSIAIPAYTCMYMCTHSVRRGAPSERVSRLRSIRQATGQMRARNCKLSRLQAGAADDSDTLLHIIPTYTFSLIVMLSSGRAVVVVVALWVCTCAMYNGVGGIR